MEAIKSDQAALAQRVGDSTSSSYVQIESVSERIPPLLQTSAQVNSLCKRAVS